MTQLNDPDFDKPTQPTDRSFFDQLDPKIAFVFGLVGSVMALCTIGFIVLLIVLLKR